jgi:hypothetical protein
MIRKCRKLWLQWLKRSEGQETRFLASERASLSGRAVSVDGTMKVMSRKILVIGFLTIAIVISTWYLLTYLPRPEESSDLEPSEEVIIPDMPTLTLPISDIFEVPRSGLYFFKVRIDPGITVTGSFNVHKLFVLNETNIKHWLTKHSFKAYVSCRAVTKCEFTFTTDQEGIYYFILDNHSMAESETCFSKIVLLELKVK